MKNRLCIAFIWCKLLFFLTPAFALNYYVTPGSTGIGNSNGSNEQNAATIEQLRTYLSSYTFTSDNELNVYFLGGTYTIPTTAITFSSSARGKIINFQPVNPADSVFLQSGTNDNANFMSINSGNTTNGTVQVTFSDIVFQNITKSGDGRLFYLQGHNHLTLERVIIRNNTFNNRIIHVSSSQNNSVNLIDIIVNNNSFEHFYYSSTAEREQFINIIRSNFKGNTASQFLIRAHNYSSTSFTQLEDCLFAQNTINNTGSSQSLINIYDTPGHVTRCTFHNNTTKNAGQAILWLQGNHNSSYINLIYNNTFSENPNITYGIYVGGARAGGIFNNTLYNSGGIYLNGLNNVRNNLIIGSYVINPGSSSYATSINRNVFSNGYYESGVSNHESIPNLLTYVGALEEYEPGKPPVHPLIISPSVINPLFRKGGRTSELGEYGSLLTNDQRGIERPDRISMGSWDEPILACFNGRYSIIYDSETGFGTYNLDLGENIISLPRNVTLDDLQYSVIQQPANGRVTPVNSRQVQFIPSTNEEGEPIPGIIGNVSDMIYRVSCTVDGKTYETEITISFIIQAYLHPLGIIDERVIRCYREMGEVEFNSRYKFVSSAISSNFPPGVTSFPNATGAHAGNNFKYNGFSIPLVGDLDGDGKPEIVAIGMAAGRIDLYQYGDYLCILNGQTGKEIVRYEFPFRTNGWYLNNGEHHSSPSSIALVDANRNGKANIIVAVGNAHNASYNYRLLCYEVNDNTFLDRDGGSDAANPNKLTLKWTSEPFATSNTSWANKAIPQIVDIDGDGIPEILVCHKIYNADTGAEIITLDENYMGRDPNARAGDQYIPFAYIYDVDMDGKYDIAAGGKLYYDIDIHKTGAAPYYKTKVMDGIGDGHTAVADINADGIPDIIVSKNQSVNTHNLYVWDPGFFEKDAVTGKLTRVNKNPEIIAKRVSYQSNYYDGSHSYIYVGDIDGREDADGNRHPEISILGGRWFSGTLQVPVHPNVAGLNNGNPFNTTNGYIPYDGGSGSNTRTGLGSLISYTWDEKATNVNDRLKVSFVLKHNDSSINTGFTLFDFNNDGRQQICYRDEYSLRIITAEEPFYDAHYEGDMSTSVRSFTGFEYPVIADVDGDGSADMIVMGQNYNRTQAFGFVYAVESTTGDFAPAPMVWNQFMYDPLKISEDLTTPLVNLHPLSQELAFVKEKDASTGKKTYIYNNTVSQTVVSADFNGVLKPIVRIPDAGIEGYVDTQNSRIVMHITNNGDATLNAQTPIRFYLEELGAANICTNLGGNAAMSVIGGDVFPGDTLIIYQSLTPTELYENYVIRVNDSSTSSHYFPDISKQENYYDCNWADNMIEVGTFVARNDAATVSQYGEILIDILANDVLPDGFNGELKEDMIIESPAVGSWSIVNNMIKYTAPVSANGQALKFRYKLTHEDISKYANVYIYILEDCTYGFSVCAGSYYQVCLKETPENIRFEWYSDAEGKDYLGDTAPYINDMQSDQKFYVKPIFADVTEVAYEGHRSVDFPLGELIISVIPSQSGHVTAIWKGLVDTDWHNPANWVEWRNGKESPIQWIPNSCVNVILEENAPHYPELTAKGVVNNITMKNRSMIAKVHQLDYNKVDLELKLKPTEKNRFVMWSPPLKNMYTGDYHFSKNGKPKWGDVYMNYFQAANPDFPASVAKESAFTATFGTVDSLLTIDKPFAIKVINLDAEATFTFPKTDLSYTPEQGGSKTINRDNTGNRFIVDGLMDPNGDFDMKVNDDTGYRMIHVSNPFMAYLDAEKFLEANKDKIEQGFKLWNGQIDDNFISYVKANDSYNYNHFITDEGELAYCQEGLIAPLQSFFVIKKNVNTKIESLKISAAMTTTLNSGETSYQLRSSEPEEWYVMRIAARQDNFENRTILHYSPQAVQAYLPEEDSRKLFNPESSLAVYTLSPSQDALAVYSSGDFSQDVRLGLRLKKAGKITLNFTGMKRFQHEVYLIDHEDDNKVYDLSVTPELTFDIEDYTTGNYIELNNRFSLNFNYAPTGTAVVAEEGIKVSSHGGFLFIEANGREISHLQVYNLWGQLVSAPGKKDIQYRIPVQANQFYLVKAELDGKIHITKVIAR